MTIKAPWQRKLVTGKQAAPGLNELLPVNNLLLSPVFRSDKNHQEWTEDS